MQSLKTYDQVNSKNPLVHFGISKMAEIYESRDGVVDVPHRHDYFTVLVVKNGDGQHNIDFNVYELSENQVFFVGPGQVHQVVENRATKGYSLVFSSDFLIENSIQQSFLDDLNLFNNYGISPPLEPNSSSFFKINEFCAQMFQLYKGENTLKFQSIGAYLKLLLIECRQACSINVNSDGEDYTRQDLIRQFKQLVNRHYRDIHSTTEYANRLNITPDYLNRLVRSAIGKTAKEYIQTKITTEAKRLLFFSPSSLKEIAYELGFDEPAYFSTFFKKCTGVSPSKFKEQNYVH